MKEKVREIFQSSAGNQRLTIENSHLAIFLSLVAGSSFIEIAYFSWVKFGYLDPLAIVFETSLLFAGFIVITVGLSRKLEKWLKFLWFTAIATLSLQVILYPYPPGLRVYTILFLAGLFITGLTYVVLEIRRGILQKILCFYSLEIIIFLIIFTIFVGFYYTRYFPSDESAIDTYAASLFLKGINPYNPSNMVNTLSIMHFPYYLGTPLLSGGLCTDPWIPGPILFCLSSYGGFFHLDVSMNGSCYPYSWEFQEYPRASGPFSPLPEKEL